MTIAGIFSAVLLLLPCLATPSSAQRLRGIPPPACYSKTSLYYSARLTVREPSDARIDIVTLSSEGPMVEIFCMMFVEDTTGMQVSDCALSVPWLCRRSTSATADAPWECEKLPQYMGAIHIETTRGSLVDKTNYHWKIQWETNEKRAACYPRQITIHTVARVVSQQSGSVVVSVIFIIFIAGIAVLVTFFGAYQFKKVNGKFWKAENKAGKRVMETLDAEIGREQAAAVVGAHTRDASVLDEHNSDEVSNSRGPKHDAGDTLPGNQWCDQSYGMPPEAIILSTPQNPMHDVWKPPTDVRTIIPIPYMETVRSQSRATMERPAATGAAESVYACVDCNMDVHDPRTPQLCNVSGKRHY